MTNQDPAKALTLSLLQQIPRELFGAVGIRLWDGTLYPGVVNASTTIVFKHPGSMRAMLIPPDETTVAEAYLRDDFDIEGDLEGLFAWGKAMSGVGQGLSWGGRASLVRGLLLLPKGDRASVSQRKAARLSGKRHSADRDRQAVTYHYDVPSEFYALWLDSNMVYSCACFLTPEQSLDQAQERKLDLICRKLRLKPGQKLLDIGCGWGGLVRHASQHYGVSALGITLSEPQAAIARQRIAADGLSERCHIRVVDYRALDESEQYDAIASVGMFEHVGEELLPAYFKQAARLLKQGGVFLNHGIARNANHDSKRTSKFVKKYVFPDGELVSLSRALHAAEPAGLETRDVESLREHYVLTLRHWLRKLEAAHQPALAIVDERTFRIWRFYLAASAYNFETADLSVFQTLMVKTTADGRSGLPLGRQDWYANA